MRGSALLGILLTALALSGTVALAGTGPARTECIAPAKPGGGFDLTCQLVQRGLQDGRYLREPMRVTYMPGGVGAVAFDAIVAQRPGEGHTLVAFSGGSLLNLAQGKFGKHTEADVRWVAAIGLDIGMFAVRANSPLRTLADLVEAIRRKPAKVVFGVGGTVGGQDWVKAARIARMANLDPRAIRYVSFEGGGEAFIALLGGHVDVVSAGILEVAAALDGGKIRVLAVFSDERLPGRLAHSPTAKEQGFPLVWPDIRGVYMGPKVSGADYRWWIDTLRRMTAAPAFERQRQESALLPLSLTGPELDAYVRKTVREYDALTREFGLAKK